MTEMKTINSAKCLNVTMKIIQFIYGVPPQNSKHHKLNTFCAILLQSFFAYLFVISQTISLFQVEDVRDIPDNLYMLVEILTSIIKGFSLLYNTKSIWRILEILHTEEFTKQTAKQNQFIVANTKVIERTSVIYISGVIICGIMFASIVILQGDHSLPYVGWFPFDEKKSPVYQLIFAWQMSGPAIMGVANSAFDMAAAGFMSLACCQLDVLHDSLTNIYETAVVKLHNQAPADSSIFPFEDMDKNVDEEVYNELVRKIKHHRLILEYLNLVEKSFTVGMFGQLAGSVIAISATIYQSTMVTDTDEKFVAAMGCLCFLMMMLSQILLYCWYGSKVYYKTSELANSIYMSNWYKCGIKIQKLFCFMMVRSTQPVLITAGKFIMIDLSTFVAVVKLAYSVYTLLQSME